jgi:hypothetical protein
MPASKRLLPKMDDIIRLADIIDEVTIEKVKWSCVLAQSILDHPDSPLAERRSSPTDEELVGRASEIAHSAPRGSELTYFLDEDSCEYETFVAILRDAAQGGMKE